jgi:hypothetical protein
MRTLLHIQINRQFILFLQESLFLFGLLVADASGTVFYVDSTGGNNANSGTTPNSAWQILTKLNGTRFSAGDKILFKTSGSWIGTLSPLGSGATNSAIVISSYGTNAAMPIINGNSNADAVILTNHEYWEINNLEAIMGINGLNGAAGCKPQSGSPCIDSGTTITTTLKGNPNAGGLDYWGNRVPYKGVTDRGANEWSGSAPGSTGKGAP